MISWSLLGFQLDAQFLYLNMFSSSNDVLLEYFGGSRYWYVKVQLLQFAHVLKKSYSQIPCLNTMIDFISHSRVCHSSRPRSQHLSAANDAKTTANRFAAAPWEWGYAAPPELPSEAVAEGEVDGPAVGSKEVRPARTSRFCVKSSP